MALVNPALAVVSADSHSQQENIEGEWDSDFPVIWNPIDAEWLSSRCQGWDNPFSDRLWVRGEYLFWWTRGSNAPPLITTSPANTDPSVAGVLGQPGTTVLYGNESLATPSHSGGRITLGYWLVPNEWNGLELSYLNLGKQANRFSAASPGTAILARPFFDTQSNSQSAQLIAHPNFLEGSVTASVSVDLQVFDAVVRGVLLQRKTDRLDLLVGYRYGSMNDDLLINHSSRWTAAQGLIPAGTTKSLFDAFNADNVFQGMEIGLDYEEHVGRWSLELLAKLGIGNNRSRVAINGQTITTVPGGGSSTFTGGLLAQSTNIGQYEQNNFALMPELGIVLGYDITPRFKATLGYTFIYWNKVARSTEQIDFNVSQLPPESPQGRSEPTFVFKTSEFWAQGINAGIEYRF